MIEIKGITKSYVAGTVHALDNVNLKIEQGEFVAIIGASGSGKSTLMHVLGLLDRPDSGSYTFLGRDVTGLSNDELAALRNHLIGFVFQQFHLLPKLTATDNACLPLIYSGKSQMKELAAERIKQVGLGHRTEHRPNQLSGGEQQRVAIARALVNEPLVIMADEPTGNLDSKSRQEIVAILQRLNREGKTIIMVTHEKEIAEHAGRIITMRDGEIISDTRTNSGGALGVAPDGHTEGSKRDQNNSRCSSATLLAETRNDSGGGEPELHAEEDTPPATECRSYKNTKACVEFPKKDDILAGCSAELNRVLSAEAAGGTAKMTDHFRQAFDSLVSHKLRSFLSMLGILIGVAAVIAMMAVTQGAQDSIKATISSMGSNLLLIYPGSKEIHGVRMEAGLVTRLTLEDVNAIGRLPAVKRSAPTVRGRGQLVFGSKNWNTQLQGAGVEYAEMHACVPQVGRFFTHAEVDTRAKVVVLGFTVVKELFGETDPIGKTMKINRDNFKVIGILPPKGAGGWRDWDDVVVIPVTTAMHRLLGKDYVDSIDVEVREAELIDAAQNEIKDLMARRYKITGDIDDSVQIRNMADIQEALSKTTQIMSLLLGSIAAISLVVGGIGIMNIMLVSVKERTREIGLRKAIGARGSDIMTQFLIEAIVMTFLGGLMGIALGAGVAVLLGKLPEPLPSRISLSSVTLAATFSIAVGLLFGLWPARQASKLDPIEALRYE